MLKTNVYNMSGELVGEIELSEAVFGVTPNHSVVHDMVKTHKVKQAGADISKNPQKASGRNPQKASARG